MTFCDTTIFCDIDGTIAATGELIYQRFGLPIETYPSPLSGRFWREKDGFEIYRDAEPLPGAIETLQRISQVYPVVYITIRPVESKFVTARWLQKHGFPQGAIRFCKDLKEKVGVVGDDLVFDDDPKAPGSYQGCLVMIARPYNKPTRTIPRTTWDEILQGEVVDCPSSGKPL